MVKVLRAEKLGFCFGVEDAIELAQQKTARADKVYSLGPVIHNRQVIDKLADAGLQSVDSLDEVFDGPVVIRAHGVTPGTLAQAEARGLDVVDATCVLVRRAQRIVQSLHEEGYSVVLIGDAHHPEVKGIVGYAPDVTVIADRDELHRLPRDGRLGIVAQTTLSQKHFAMMVGEIISRPFREIKVANTLCVEVVHRQEAAIALCEKVDCVFVLGGLHSANTQELARLCEAEGVPTYHLESLDGFRTEYVRGHRVTGVTAGASTPSWIVDQFVKHLESLDVID